ncbi:capsular exopolysaccharide biosynthesis protein [Cylindrospermum stagnale PCC 7417]|uniref:non-specific protein-tyrosine kinase n=1 Tax=Cylindrospermum stagnale PCC 7417 TaxID=56107 RepID=K9X2J8_9NOST|nr:polysaccharide biosynthesis tyrosine autokinase [Cylindrospermum stagnale]AFZ26281.1 capsular exopolysaccharide biosynthesis protein [Cylindrospermum stagnale PCC 7417]
MQSTDSGFHFDKYWQIIKHRWLTGLGIFIPTLLLLLLALSLKKPSYVAEGTLKLQKINSISSLTGVGTEIGKLEPLVQDNKTNPINTEAEVIRSVPIVQKTIDRLKLKNNKGKSLNIKDFLKNFTVNDIQKTDILKISYKDANPKIAAQVVNMQIEVYLEHNLISQKSEATAARQFLEKQVPNAELILRKLEAASRDFKEKNQVISLQEEATKGVEITSDLERQIRDTQSKIAGVTAQFSSIQKQLAMTPQVAVAVNSMSQSTGVQDILKEVQQLESQLAARRTFLQDSHPEIINLKQKLEALNEILEKRKIQVTGTNSKNINDELPMGMLQQQLTARLVELESTYLGLTSELSTLIKLQAIYRQRLNKLPQLEQQQRELERKLQTAQSTYSLLLQKLQESRIAENQTVGNVIKVSEAQVPEEPNSSISMFISAALLAMIATLVIVFILEAQDKTIKTVDEAKKLFELTLLGVIPSVDKLKKSIRVHEENESYSERSIVKNFPRSPISEAYRMLRANLKFMSADKELKVIVVTSSVPREGKTTVATNLAVAIAQMECKVLLIDGDLHRPVQHKIWDLTNSQGLTNLIVGQTEIKTAIKKVMDNLDVLTSGVVPPSPGSLLDSKRMASLIEIFSANYDFVIIDAPSLNVAADAATLGQMADGVLLVVRPGVVDSVNAAFAKEVLEKSGQNVLGQVVNGVIPKNEPYSYYYFTEEDYAQEGISQAKSMKKVKSSS